MKKVTIIFIVLFCCCTEKYKATVKECNNKLYTEIIGFNPAGLDRVYLTDSLSFRVLLGTLDEEHETFSIQCDGDHIYVKKSTTGNNCRWKVLKDNTKTLICDTIVVEEKILRMANLKSQNKIK